MKVSDNEELESNNKINVIFSRRIFVLSVTKIAENNMEYLKES